jgi:GNAT superfamily N-acetyltransferase
VETLSETDRSAVVDVLSGSFFDYPVMRYVLSDSGEDYFDHLRELMGFFCDVRFARGWPVLGIHEHDHVAAVMLLGEPSLSARSVDLDVIDHDLERTIGKAALDRITQYERLSSLAEPEGPYYFVGMLGVLPVLQGKGMGGALLDHAATIAQADSVARGVCLATEDEKNVGYYRRFGYEVVGEAQVGDVHTWCLFRPNE